MSVFLIDYENVRTAAFNGLEDLTENDSVIVFYTANSDNLTFSLMHRLTASRAHIEYKKVACGGKNSLDFQLCSYLGYLIGTSSNTRFCIISRDKGFSTMLSLWGESAANGNCVICSTNIYNGSGSRPISEAEMEDSAEDIDALPEAAEHIEAEASQPETQPEAQPEPKPAARNNKKETKQEKKSEQAEPTPTENSGEKAENPVQRKRRTYKRKPKAPSQEQPATA